MKAPKRQLLTISLFLFFLFPSALLSQDKNLAYDFVKAATNGKIDEVKTLLQSGVNINTQIEHGYSALMLAAGNGQEDVVKYLLKNGANVNLQANLKETALHLAAGNGRKSIVELLVTNGADFRVSDTGLTPLMMAVAGGHSEDSQ